MNITNSSLRATARATLLGRYGSPMFAMVLATLIPSLLLFPFSYLFLRNEVTSIGTIIYLVASMLTTVLEFVFSAGIIFIHMNLAREKATDYRHVFFFFKNGQADRYLIAGFVQTLLIMVPTIPGIIANYTLAENEWLTVLILTLIGTVIDFYIMLRFGFVANLLIDDESLKPLDAFKKSFDLTRGHTFQLFKMHCAFIGWYLLCLPTLGLGLLWVEPYVNQSITYFYLNLTGFFQVQVDISKEGLAKASASMEEVPSSAESVFSNETADTTDEPDMEDVNTNEPPVSTALHFEEVLKQQTKDPLDTIKEIDDDSLFDE